MELKAIWFRFAQRLRDLVKIKTAESNNNIFNPGVRHLSPQERHLSPEHEDTINETPTTFLVTPV